MNRHLICGSWLRFWEIRTIQGVWFRFDFCDKCEVFTVADDAGTIFTAAPKNEKGNPNISSIDFTQRT